MAIRINVNVEYGTTDGEISKLEHKLNELGFECVNAKSCIFSDVHDITAEYLKI